jgi:hypothetical protein
MLRTVDMSRERSEQASKEETYNRTPPTPGLTLPTIPTIAYSPAFEQSLPFISISFFVLISLV